MFEMDMRTIKKFSSVSGTIQNKTKQNKFSFCLPVATVVVDGGGFFFFLNFGIGLLSNNNNNNNKIKIVSKLLVYMW